LSKLRTFGCTAYAIIPETQRHKLSDRAIKCIFLGYDDTDSGYILFDNAQDNFIKSLDVRFNEDEYPFRELNHSDKLVDFEPEDYSDDTYSPDDRSERIDLPNSWRSEDEDGESYYISINDPHQAVSPEDPPMLNDEHPSSNQPILPTPPGGSGKVREDEDSDCRPQSAPRRSARKRKQRDFGFHVDSSCINSVKSNSAVGKIPIPRSFSEALRGPHAAEWKKAIDSELASHAENATWSLVDAPKKWPARK
jgi:hypothetical protein